MHSGQIVFSQIVQHMPMRRFLACVNRYEGDYRVKNFTCRDQFLAMAFAQLAFSESLRDIEASLNLVPVSLYHMGFRSKRIARNTLAKAIRNIVVFTRRGPTRLPAFNPIKRLS